MLRALSSHLPGGRVVGVTPACAACIVLLTQPHHEHRDYAPDSTPVWEIILAFVCVMIVLSVVSAIFDWWSRRD